MFAMRQSPARVDDCSVSMSRISNTSSMNAFSRCISLGGGRASAAAISRAGSCPATTRTRRHAVAEIDGFLDRVRHEEHRRLRFAPQLVDEQLLHVQAASSDRARRTARPSG